MNANKRKRTNTWLLFQNDEIFWHIRTMVEDAQSMTRTHLFPNKTSSSKVVLCLGASSKHLNSYGTPAHSFCGAEQFLYERNLYTEQICSNLNEEIQLTEKVYLMGTSQSFIQEKIFQQLLTQDVLRTRNKWVWFQSLQQCFPNGRCPQEESNQTSVMQKATVNIKGKSLGSTLDTELWLRTEWKMHHYFTFLSRALILIEWHQAPSVAFLLEMSSSSICLHNQTS